MYGPESDQPSVDRSVEDMKPEERHLFQVFHNHSRGGRSEAILIMLTSGWGSEIRRTCSCNTWRRPPYMSGWLRMINIIFVQEIANWEKINNLLGFVRL